MTSSTNVAMLIGADEVGIANATERGLLCRYSKRVNIACI